MSLSPQALLVIPLVAACSGHAAWALLPAAGRRKVAIALARVPWFGRLRAVVRAAAPPSGCGCDGCDRATPPVQQRGISVIRIAPPPPRR